MVDFKKHAMFAGYVFTKFVEKIEKNKDHEMKEKTASKTFFVTV